MGLPRPRWIEPVRQSPRPLMFGSFAQGTVHLNSLNSLTRRLTPTVIIRRLPRATPLADYSAMQLSPHFRYHAAVRLLAQHHLPLRFSLIGSLIVVPPTNYASSPEVTRCSSVPCCPQTPWCGGANENAFASIVQARPLPTFGRPVHLRGSPHRLRPGTSPHALRISPRGEHPALRRMPSLRRPARLLTPLSDMTLLIRASEGLQPS
jgi:hypothetical protein